MSNNLPKIYASCRAGCNWETVHRSEVEDIIIALQEAEPESDGRWLLEEGKTYKIKDFCEEGQAGWAFTVKITRCVARTETGEVIHEVTEEIYIPLPEHNGYDNFVKFRFKGMEITNISSEPKTYGVNIYYDLNGSAQCLDCLLTGKSDVSAPSMYWPYEIVDVYVEGAKKVYAYTDDIALVGFKGEKGEKGDPPEVVQTTGGSETAVMSQKATTDAFNNYASCRAQPININFTIDANSEHFVTQDIIALPLKAGERFCVTASAWCTLFSIVNGVAQTELGRTYAGKAMYFISPSDIDGIGFYSGNSTNESIKVNIHIETDTMVSAKNIDKKLGDQARKNVALNSWVLKYYMKTNSISNTLTQTLVGHHEWKHQLVAVSAGDLFYIHGQGGGEPKLWAFTDTDYTVLTASPGSVTYSTPTLICAPADGYLLVNVNVNTANGLTKIVEPTISAQMADINSRLLNLKSFGAVGDGVTDDTDAINLALTQATNKVLFVPEGVYLFSGTLHIHSGTTVIGCGENSVFQLADDFELDAVSWRPDTYNALHKYPMIAIDETAQGCLLKNFTLIGQDAEFKDENEDGILVQGSNHILENLVVHNINYFKDKHASRWCLCLGWGINVFKASVVTVRNCNVYNSGYENIGVEESEAVTISDCKVGDGCQCGMQVHRYAEHIKIIGNTVYQTENVRDVNCAAFTMDASVGVDMNDILVANNSFASHINTVAAGENNVRIIGNYVDGILYSNTIGNTAFDGIYPKGLIISNNIINGRINMKADNAVVANNIINNDTENYMIRIYGNNVEMVGNVGVGVGKTTTTVEHI